MEWSFRLACLLEVGVEGFTRGYGLLEEGLRKAIRLCSDQLCNYTCVLVAVPVAVLLKLSCRMPMSPLPQSTALSLFLPIYL